MIVFEKTAAQWCGREKRRRSSGIAGIPGWIPINLHMRPLGISTDGTV